MGGCNVELEVQSNTNGTHPSNIKAKIVYHVKSSLLVKTIILSSFTAIRIQWSHISEKSASVLNVWVPMGKAAPRCLVEMPWDVLVSHNLL